MATSQTWLLRPFQERSTQVFLGVLFAALVLVTFLHLFMPEDSALHVSAYTVTLLGKYLCYALLAVARPGVGLPGHSQPGPRCLLCPGRLRHGHVPDAPDRRPGRVRRPGTARLHGVPELGHIALVLAGFRFGLVCLHHGVAGPGPAGTGVWLSGLPLPGNRGVPVDHHSGAHLRADAGFLPQRNGLWRQQRPDRFPGHTRL